MKMSSHWVIAFLDMVKDRADVFSEYIKPNVAPLR